MVKTLEQKQVKTDILSSGQETATFYDTNLTRACQGLCWPQNLLLSLLGRGVPKKHFGIAEESWGLFPEATLKGLRPVIQLQQRLSPRYALQLKCLAKLPGVQIGRLCLYTPTSTGH